MKIILTGSSGFVGRELSKTLFEIGHSLIGIDRVDCKNNYLSEFVCVDLSTVDSKRDKVFLKYGPVDLLINCAAAKGDYDISADSFQRDNVKASQGLLKLMENLKIQSVIHYSTVSVYGHDNIRFDEKAELNPNNDYGKTKLEAEEIFLDWFNLRPKRNLTILRPSVIYGENSYTNIYNLLAFLNRPIVVSIGNGGNVKSMISLENIINITLFAINKKGLNIYNCTDSPHYTIKELIEIICELRGFNKPLLSIPLYVAYIIAIPFELFSKLLNRDLKISRERFYKFSKATDYRSELLRAEGYIQVYSPKERIHSLAKWFLKEKL